MKIIVVGLGSMGRRRIRLLAGIDKNIEIYGVDLSDDRQKQAQKELSIPTFSSIKDAVQNFSPDTAFVCTSPISHGNIVLECLNNNLNVFTEINLLNDWYEEAQKIAQQKELKLFISSTFLYRKEMQYLKENLKGEIVNYIYHSGQYLPDWHPWQSYKNFFVSNPKTNGCREIFAIELPWIINTFGEIKDFCVMKSKMSTLDIEYNDNYIVSILHKNGTKGVFCLDVVSRKAVRSLEIFNENKHIFWDGTPQGLKVYNTETKTEDFIQLYSSIEKNNNYTKSIIENAYSDEIIDFISMCQNNTIPKYSFERDYEILNLIDRIEEDND